MGPPPMVVAIVAIVFCTWAFVSVSKLVLAFFRDKNADRSAGSSLTSSELAHLVENAVHEAVRPLEEKIERLERRQRIEPAHDPFEERAQLSDHEAMPIGRPAE